MPSGQAQERIPYFTEPRVNPRGVFSRARASLRRAITICMATLLLVSMLNILYAAVARKAISASIQKGVKRAAYIIPPEGNCASETETELRRLPYVPSNTHLVAVTVCCHIDHDRLYLVAKGRPSRATVLTLWPWTLTLTASVSMLNQRFYGGHGNAPACSRLSGK